MRFVKLFFVVALVASMQLALVAAPKALEFAAIKGPSGIGLIKLFEDTQPLSDGRAIHANAVPSSDLMLTKLLGAEYDVGILPIDVAARIAVKDQSLTLLAITGTGMLSFLTSDSNVKTITDLKGKTVYVAGQHATPDLLFQKLLQGAGLDPAKDVTLKYNLAYPELAAALASGTVQYAVLPEPFTTLALSKNPKLFAPFNLAVRWKILTGLETYPLTALVVRTKYYNENKLACIELALRAQASINSVVADPVAASKLVEKNKFGLPPAVAAQAIPKSAYTFIKAKDAQKQVEALLNIFMNNKDANFGTSLPSASFYADY